jgi:hypothetical protein
MADFRLPPPTQGRNVDLLGSLYRGFALPMAAQQAQSQNALAEMQMAERQEKQNAFRKYSQSKNPDDLMGVDPQGAAAVKEHAQKAALDLANAYYAATYGAMSNPATGRDMWGSWAPKAQELLKQAGLHINLGTEYPANPTEFFKPPSAMQKHLEGLLKQATPHGVSKWVNPADPKDVRQFSYENPAPAGWIPYKPPPPPTTFEQEREFQKKDPEGFRKFHADKSPGGARGGQGLSFTEFAKDPRIAAMPYPEQVREFKKLQAAGTAEGREGVKYNLTPAKMAKNVKDVVEQRIKMDPIFSLPRTAKNAGEQDKRYAEIEEQVWHQLYPDVAPSPSTAPAPAPAPTATEPGPTTPATAPKAKVTYTKQEIQEAEALLRDMPPGPRRDKLVAVLARAKKQMEK